MLLRSVFRSVNTSCCKMPFVAMSGFPSSGKSTRAKELELYLCKEKGVNARIIAESDFGLDKNVIYADSIKEKELRGNLKSSVQRILNKEDVIILDSLNYIKGCRYELYCVTKSCQTPQCIIYCGTSVELATKWNKGRKDEDKYSEDIFNALVMRFEAPDSRNRWDKPLFVLQSDDPLPCQQIYEALFHSKAPPPNLSTLSQPISSTNFLHELDQITQRTVNLIMEAQKTCVPGDSLSVPGAKDKVELGRPLTLAELQRMRRQFISYTKTHPVDDTTKLTNIFVQFLNNSFR